MHMVESGFSNRLICLDSETRIWKFADKFCIGEFIETTPLGGAVYPTLGKYWFYATGQNWISRLEKSHDGG